MRRSAWFLVVLFAFFFWFPAPAYGVISSCTASVSPSSVTRNESTQLSFTVNNTSDTGAVWIKVTRPSSNFTVTGGSAAGWGGSSDDSSVTLTGGTLAASGSESVAVAQTAADTEAGSASWTVQMSDSSDGSGATTCTGDTGVSIGGGGGGVPSLSDLVVSDVTDSQVKITWTTDISSTSVVDYGTTDSYGSSATGDSSVTSHSVTISSLTANTTYHYNAKSTGSGGTGESGDNTFTTAKAGQTGTTTSGTVTTTTSVKATPTPVPDTAGPYVVLSTSLDKPFTLAPAIKGTATDKSGVSSIEYSVDDGHNWLPVDFIDKPNTTRTDFTFTPQLLDGNYILKMRAKDGKGNASTSDGGTLIVDRLPPRIGGVVFSLGPQELIPAANGTYTVPAGLDYKITLSAVGGPLSIDIRFADHDGSLRKTSLKKNPDNGLWNAFLRFEHPGDYTLSVDSIDGADNSITQELAHVTVLASGRVMEGTTVVTNGKVAVYYLDDATKRFVLWDGSAYGQPNPQPLTPEGGYRLYIPAGTYYLRVAAGGYKTLITSIFTIQEPYPIVSNFSLTRARALRIGPWLIPLPDFTQTTTAIDVHSVTSSRVVIPAAVGQEFPYFSLAGDRAPVTSTSLRGKPTLIVILNTWLPQAAAQLAVLTELATQTELNVVAILPQESVSSVSIFKKRAGYSFPVVADPDGDLVEALGLHTLPAHIVVNRKGVVQSIQNGLYDKQQLLDMIIQ